MNSQQLAANTNMKTGSTAKHILVVDDDPEVLRSIKDSLQLEGHTVSTARDGTHGLGIAETQDIDLMILDMMMPKRSGFLVLERLRQHTDKTYPVIMITGNEGDRHQKLAGILGVDEYIRKPFTMDLLVDTVKKLLARGSDN